MSPITHFLAGWALAHTAELNPRERMLVSVAGIIPDLDGFGIVVDLATRGATDWWGKYHHELGHNIGFCLLVTVAFAAFAQRKGMTVLLVFLSFHLHLLCDLAGARGPDGDQWPNPLPRPVFAGAAPDLERPVGAQRLAEPAHHRRPARPRPALGVAARLLAVGAGERPGGCGVRGGAAAKVPGGGGEVISD